VLVQCSTSIRWNRRTIWREAMELVRPGGDGHLRNASILVLVLLLRDSCYCISIVAERISRIVRRFI
jgi:hypothetical protein